MGMRTYEMSTFNQFLNFLSIHGLEKAGLSIPNQKQLDCVEICLKDALRIISSTVVKLHSVGITEPSLDEIKKIIKEYYQNIPVERSKC